MHRNWLAPFSKKKVITENRYNEGDESTNVQEINLNLIIYPITIFSIFNIFIDFK